MKTTMRRGTFETNSSSTHTLILVPYDVADRWRSLGEDYWLDMALVESDAEESGNGYDLQIILCSLSFYTSFCEMTNLIRALSQ